MHQRNRGIRGRKTETGGIAGWVPVACIKETEGLGGGKTETVGIAGWVPNAQEKQTEELGGWMSIDVNLPSLSEHDAKSFLALSWTERAVASLLFLSSYATSKSKL